MQHIQLTCSNKYKYLCYHKQNCPKASLTLDLATDTNYLWMTTGQHDCGNSNILCSTPALISHMAVKIDSMDKKSEIEDNNINHEIEEKVEKVDENQLESKERELSYLKVIVLDIILPLFDVAVDIMKGLLLIFQYENLSSFYRFEAHFNENGIYGLVSISLKWIPAIVAALHFQDINR